MAGIKGKWAQGIQPRNFAWIIKDKLAVCERPGGYGVNHRRVRRQEEIIWIREQGFSYVISLIPSPHNLHNYDELSVAWRHRPFSAHDDPYAVLMNVYPELHELIAAGDRLLLHQDELGDRVAGLVAGYLVWAKIVPAGPQAISIIEQIVHRQMGPIGRQLVTVAGHLPPPAVLIERRRAEIAAQALADAEAAARAQAEGDGEVGVNADASAESLEDLEDLDGHEAEGEPREASETTTEPVRSPKAGDKQAAAKAQASGAASSTKRASQKK